MNPERAPAEKEKEKISMKKRVIAAMLAALMVVSTLAGCGSG